MESAVAVAGSVVFFFNDTATTEIYTLSLHDALPICPQPQPATTRQLLQRPHRTARHRGSRPRFRGSLRSRRGPPMLGDPVATTFRDAIQQLAGDQPIVAGSRDVRVELVNNSANFPDGNLDAEVSGKMLGRLWDSEGVRVKVCHPKMLRVWSELSHLQRGKDYHTGRKSQKASCPVRPSQIGRASCRASV